ncbi:hypothetical protein PRK78_000548 [Emydomyces testavorans]|uniref:5'-deoxynucleotidase n=1 Tax=Emydomyces testavorans TaxID=2070801 RepID=A0AAF0IEK0_9EURO|nr:hypothetical protein PRK78_000548 [Emydomyces testavorans]
MEPDEMTASPFPFLHLVERLKNLPRRGWQIRGVQCPESVSDHMYRMAVMTLLVPGVDEKTRARAVKMALVHDMGEAIIGDITPSDGISKEDKYNRERLAIRYLSCLAEEVNPAFAAEIMELWLEFEEGTSPAAKLVREEDSLECMDQAVIYEERSRLDKDLGEFMELESRITAPELVPWVAHLKKDREHLWSRGGADIVVIFVIGGPGVGKGTQCARIAQDFACMHISVGDLLREEAKSQTRIADFINESMRYSVVAPADLTIRLLQKKMNESNAKGRRMFVVDGFPRSLEQAYAFEAKSSGRIDDNVESIKKRIHTFQTTNSEVEEHLMKMGPFWRIDADGTADEVYTSVKIKVWEISQKAHVAP